MSKEDKKKQHPRKNKSENKTEEKKGIARYLNPEIELVDVTEEKEGQTTVFFGRPSRG